jgi:hypothetical protein
VREWDGKSQRVMVLDQGFAWNDTTYRSLTQIAFAMTGTRLVRPSLLRPTQSSGEAGMMTKPAKRVPVRSIPGSRPTDGQIIQILCKAR